MVIHLEIVFLGIAGLYYLGKGMFSITFEGVGDFYTGVILLSVAISFTLGTLV